MFKQIVFVALQFLGVCATSQNLVPNHDFSDLKSNINSVGLIIIGSEPFLNWRAHKPSNGERESRLGSVHDTACYLGPWFGGCPGFTANSSALDLYTPLPYEGKGYNSLVYYKNPLLYQGSALTSIAYNRLTEVLAKDTAYCTEMSVRFTDGKIGIYSCYTHNGLGMHFRQDSALPSSRPWDDGIVPQVSGFGYITNTNHWRKLKGSFTADGTEEYVLIGNFNPLASAPLQIGNNPDCTSYGIIFMDAVYVYNCNDTLFSVHQKDTTVCYGQPVTLSPTRKGFKLQDSTITYHWQAPSGTTSTTDTFFIATEPGSYTVEIEINKRFTSSTTFYVNWVEKEPDNTLLDSTYRICMGKNIPLSVPQYTGAKYSWSNGDTTAATVYNAPGNHIVEITTPCWQHQEYFTLEQDPCEIRLFVPNAFTPNGDGNNDYFQFYGPEEPIKLWVFNRWGQTVFYSANYKNNWDGTYNGAVLPTDSYTYLIEYKVVNPNATQPNPEGSVRQERGIVNILP